MENINLSTEFEFKPIADLNLVMCNGCKVIKKICDMQGKCGLSDCETFDQGFQVQKSNKYKGKKQQGAPQQKKGGSQQKKGCGRQYNLIIGNPDKSCKYGKIVHTKHLVGAHIEKISYIKSKKEFDQKMWEIRRKLEEAEKEEEKKKEEEKNEEEEKVEEIDIKTDCDADSKIVIEEDITKVVKCQYYKPNSQKKSEKSPKTRKTKIEYFEAPKRTPEQIKAARDEANRKFQEGMKKGGDYDFGKKNKNKKIKNEITETWTQSSKTDLTDEERWDRDWQNMGGFVFAN
jgi:hypothetical protein